MWVVLPVAVVVVVVVAPQGCQAPQADGVGEEDLCASIHPHLETQNKQGGPQKNHPGEKNKPGENHPPAKYWLQICTGGSGRLRGFGKAFTNHSLKKKRECAEREIPLPIPAALYRLSLK